MQVYRKSVFLYVLLAAYAPGSPQGDDGYGLFDSSNQTKEVAVALHNFTTLLADPGAGAATWSCKNPRENLTCSSGASQAFG